MSTKLPLVDRLRRLPPAKRQAIFDMIREKHGVGALADLRNDREGFWMRESQIVTDEELNPPDRKKPALVCFTGPRGDGKTYAAVHLFDKLITTGRAKHPRIFAATEADVDKAVVHGLSGIMSLYSETDPMRPVWLTSEGSAGVLRYPNGVEVLCFSAKSTEQAVGYSGDLDLYDDVAKWGASAYTAWGHARVSCRVGMGLGIVATTRRGTHLLQRLLKGDLEGVLMKRGDDLEANKFNLSRVVYDQVRAELGETDFVRRELDDEDVSAASPFVGLDFDSAPIRVMAAPRSDFTEVVIAIDPAEGKGGDHDEWGIGAAGRREDRHVVALDDGSGSYDDDEAATKALELCELWDARRIIVESNRGPRVLNAIRAAYYRRQLEAREDGREVRPMPEIVPIRAKDGKALRAGPLRILYAQGTLHHAPGLRIMERQMREWDPDAPRRPRVDDRIDWWVHAVHHLADLSGAMPFRRDQVEGLGDRVRAMKAGRRGEFGGTRIPRGAVNANGLITHPDAPPGDPRERPRGRRYRRGGIAKKKIW